MEAREGMNSGVTVIGAGTPPGYHMASRSGNTIPDAGSPEMATTPMSVEMAGTTGKKKRGRPRKYGPEGTVTMATSPLPISNSAPPAANFSGGKRGTRRPGGLEYKHNKKVGMETIGDWNASSVGTNFLPHIITANPGEDITKKVISFSQQGPRAICVLSACGVISNVTLRQPDSSGGTLTYEGRFDILSLSGSFTPTESQGTMGRLGGLSISLASPDGHVIGGVVAGLLIAANLVQVVVGSFLPSNEQEQKPKKQKMESIRAPTCNIPATIPASNADKQDTINGLNQQNYSAPRPNFAALSAFRRENWTSMHTFQDSRNSATDINISLQGS